MFLFIPVPFSVSTLIQILQHLMFVWHLIRVSLQFYFGLRCFPCPIQLNYLTFNCFLISSGFVIHNCHLAQLRWWRHVNNVINFQWLCKITHVTMKKKNKAKFTTIIQISVTVFSKDFTRNTAFFYDNLLLGKLTWLAKNMI